MRSTRTSPLDEFAAGREVRRIDDPVLADPAWEHGTGFKTYRSLEQRQAVRALLSSAPDATVLVLLPTGSGKSLVGMLSALVAGTGMVSVVVVPTTSLAVDQEEQLRACLRRIAAPDAESTFAFFSDLAQDVRNEVMTRVRDGGQRVVFTSPESLLGPLRDPLISAARSGRLGQLVFDEAHMVTTWGSDFRPDFQALAGFREELVSQAAKADHVFRTVLMTATATARDIATLSRLYASDGRRIVVGGAVALRPELAFEAVECADVDLRRARVQEALLHLPRPTFVYCTRREDVEDLQGAVGELGMGRVRRVTGESDAGERRSALDALRGPAGGLPTADIVVATSAFGLGIDVEDVRCVVHACLPESLDRAYQEVGRAGRDGRAAQGLMLWTHDDESVARALSEESLVTVDMARKRWRTMIVDSASEDRTIWLPMDALRMKLLRHSRANEEWNTRTLASMARSELLRLVGARRVDDRSLELGVELLRSDLESETAWDGFDRMRQESRVASRDSLNQVLAFARGGGICDALRDAYSVHSPERITADLVAHQACGGCAACSPPGLVPTLPLPLPFASVAPAEGADAPQQNLTALPTTDGAVLALQHGTADWPRTYRRLIESAGARGIRQIVTTPAVLAQRDVERGLRNAVSSYGVNAPFVTQLAEDPLGDLAYAARVTTLLLLAPTETPRDTDAIIDRMHDMPAPRILVLPATTRSPLRPDMTLADLYPSAMAASALVERLAA